MAKPHLLVLTRESVLYYQRYRVDIASGQCMSTAKSEVRRQQVVTHTVLNYASEYLKHLILMLILKQLPQILEELKSMRLTELLLKILKILYVIKNRLIHEQKKSNYVACLKNL